MEHQKAEQDIVSLNEETSLSLLPFKQKYPLVITRINSNQTSSLGDWLKMNSGVVNECLMKYGSLLFRNFGLETATDFNAVVSSYEKEALKYTHRTTPRSEVNDRVYTSTDYPPELIINMHNESSYSLHYPNQLMFFCNIPAVNGGETPVADSRLLFNRLKETTRAKLLDKGVMYRRKIGGGIGLDWQEVFQLDDKTEVEKYCTEHQMQFEWDDDSLILTWKRPAFQKHPTTGEWVWFNHAYFYNPLVVYDEEVLNDIEEEDLPFNTFYGDGSKIEAAVIKEIQDIYDDICVAFKWQKGDLLLMDNLLAAHGRNSFEGKRQILVSMF